MFLTLFFFRTWFAFLAVDRDVYAIRTIHIDSIEGFCKHIYIYIDSMFFFTGRFQSSYSQSFHHVLQKNQMPMLPGCPQSLEWQLER